MSLMQGKYERGIMLLSYAMLVLGIFLNILPFFAPHMLWVDEAMLASSIGTRELGELTATPLDFGQSAPFLWLYLVKLTTLLFGFHTTALRLWSLLFFFGLLGIFYVLLKRVFAVRHACFFTAILSLYPFFIQYAHEFKPYTSECFWVFLTFALFLGYFRRRLTLVQVALACTVIVWFSFAAAFFVAGGLLTAFFARAARERDGRGILVSLLVAVSFGLCYVVWLSATDSNAGAPEYWRLLKLPILPTSLGDLRLLGHMVKEVLAPLRHTAVFYVVFAFWTLWTWRHRERLLLAYFCVTGGLLLVAATLGLYPVVSRLYAFVSVFLLFLAAISMDRLWTRWEERGVQRRWLVLCAVLLVLFPLRYAAKGFYSGNLFTWPNEETQANYVYLTQHLRADDFVYVQDGAQPAYLFLAGYPDGGQNTWQKYIGTTRGHVMYGQSPHRFFYEKPYSYEGETNWENVEADVQKITSHPSVYLFTAHIAVPESWENLLSELEKYGEVTVVQNVRETRLYHFERRETK